MQFDICSPTKAFIDDATSQDIEYLTKELTYTNTANQHALKRHYNNTWLRNKNVLAWELKRDELKASIVNTLLYEENGQRYVRPASLVYLDITGSSITSEVTYPMPKVIPWAKPLPFKLHDYQELSVEKLIKVRHGNVELCTGSGKSAILLKVCRETGFRTAIVAPSTSIFNELLEKFEHHLGKGNVGAIGDGKRRLGKRFTVCIGDSLANIEKGTEEWNFFSKLDMLCVDESHTWGAETLEALCHGIFADVPYRMFFSGTQTRGDGTEKLLQSIIGETVHRLTTREAIEKGYICNHDFTIVDIESSNPNVNSSDVLEMKRIHFLRNRNIATFIAKLANAEATTNRRQTLVLVEQLDQIAMLIPLLKVPFAYAHSDSNPKKLVPLGLSKVDKDESVEKFNKNEVQVLIGTSCIAVGTNIFPTHNTVNWVGGSSEIKTKQGTVGRSVRLSKHNPWENRCTPKTICHIWDFNVHDIYIVKKQLEDRIICYRDSGTPIKRIKLRAV